jgi:hypothetical protein
MSAAAARGSGRSCAREPNTAALTPTAPRAARPPPPRRPPAVLPTRRYSAGVRCANYRVSCAAIGADKKLLAELPRKAAAGSP